MPIFEFHCGECSKDSEVLVRTSEWLGQADCPHCGSFNLEKKLSVFATSSGESSITGSEIPSCSGMPSNCGRCTLDN
jgi:putative FmdB family regulatory protein